VKSVDAPTVLRDTMGEPLRHEDKTQHCTDPQ